MAGCRSALTDRFAAPTGLRWPGQVRANIWCRRRPCQHHRRTRWRAGRACSCWRAGGLLGPVTGRIDELERDADRILGAPAHMNAVLCLSLRDRQVELVGQHRQISPGQLRTFVRNIFDDAVRRPQIAVIRDRPAEERRLTRILRFSDITAPTTAMPASILLALRHRLRPRQNATGCYGGKGIDGANLINQCRCFHTLEKMRDDRLTLMKCEYTFASRRDCPHSSSRNRGPLRA